MTEIDKLLAAIYSNPTDQAVVNKFYLCILRSYLYVPTNKEFSASEVEPYQPLIVEDNQQYFMLAFDSLERLQIWAGENIYDISRVILRGRDLLKCIGENVHLCLNFGTAYYKEFSPQEVLHLKTVIAKTEILAKEN